MTASPAHDETKVTIPPDALRNARERVGLSLADCANQASRILKKRKLPELDAVRLASIEAGDELATWDEAEALSSAVLVPFYYLLAGELPGQSITDFRRPFPARTSDLLSYDTHWKLHRFGRFYDLVSVAVRGVSTEEIDVPSPPRTASSSISHRGEALGETMRRSLASVLTNPQPYEAPSQDAGETENYFQQVRSGLEDLGIFVFMLSLNVQEIRGASRWDAGRPPAILVNSADSPAARTFTLLHEFAHLVENRGRVSDVPICNPKLNTAASPREERTADWAAGAALVSSESVHSELQGASDLPSSYRAWPPRLRQQLRRRFQVSQSVISIRLVQLGYCTEPWVQSSFWSAGGGFGKPTTKATRLRRYLGERALASIGLAVKSGTISAATAAGYLEEPVSYARLLFQESESKA